MNHALAHDVQVEEVSVEDGRRMLHDQTMDKLGIGREAFLENLEAGVYDDTDDESVLRLVMLAPFGR